MRHSAALVAALACAFPASAFAKADAVGEASPVTVSTGLPSNINPGIPGISSNPTLNGVPAQNPAPTPPEARAGTVPTSDAAMQTPAPPPPAPVANAPAAAASAPPVRPSNADLRRAGEVRDALLKAFPRTPGANGVPASGGIDGLRVTSRRGKVILRGTVSTQQLKDAAAARAAALVGGDDNVDDRLVVK